MIPFGWARTTVVASIFLSVAVGKADSQTAQGQPPSTTAELARGIASTLDAFTLRSPPGSPLEFKSVTSTGNVVEMIHIANDLAAFDRFKSKADKFRETLVGYWCDRGRVAYLRQGVVVHMVYERSDKKDQVKFTFDKSSCTGKVMSATGRQG